MKWYIIIDDDANDIRQFVKMLRDSPGYLNDILSDKILDILDTRLYVTYAPMVGTNDLP